MKKRFVLILIIAMAPFIAGLYGMINDQLTYTISPEYYTKFKFYQFGLEHTGKEAIFPHPRLQVATVGFLATWWVGIPAGILIGLVGLIHRKGNTMLKAAAKAIFITIIVAWITGLAGLVYGWFHLAETGVNWWLPENLVNKKNFIAVGSMHNFSYIGGIIGIIAGIISIITAKKDRNQ